MPQGKPTLDRIAGEVGGNLSGVGMQFPITLIIALIGLAIQAFMACKKTPAEAAESMKAPNFLERFQLRRIVRKQVKTSEQREALEAALLDAGRGMDASTVEVLFQEIQS